MSSIAHTKPTFAETLDEVVPLVDVVPVAGPPILFVLAPWLLLGLMLSAPFAVLVTLLLVFALAAVLLAAVAATLAAPVVLLRRMHRNHRAARPTPAPAVTQGAIGEVPLVSVLVATRQRG